MSGCEAFDQPRSVLGIGAYLLRLHRPVHHGRNKSAHAGKGQDQDRGQITVMESLEGDRAHEIGPEWEGHRGDDGDVYKRQTLRKSSSQNLRRKV